MKKIILTLIIMTSIVNADVFDKGRSSVGVVLGSSYAYGEQYTILGVGVDYFVADGFSVGAGYRGWFGGNPSINQLTIASSYYIPLSKKFRPYVGAFLRETFMNYDEIDDRDYLSYGARGGLAITMSPSSYVSLGYAYEEYADCKDRPYLDCSSSYPEIVFSLAF